MWGLLTVHDVQGKARHRLLGEDGLCSAGAKVSPGDIYINKEVPTNTRDTHPGVAGAPPMVYKPAPTSYKGPEGELVMVDKVLLANNDEGSMVVKVCPLCWSCGMAA